MPAHVAIEGSGVGASCCAQLLQSAGVAVSTDAQVRAASPVLLLSAQTYKLLRDVFGTSFVVEDAIHLTKRVVKWGTNTEVAVLPHAGLVVKESELLASLWEIVAQRPKVPVQPQSSAEWQILSSRAAHASQSQRFGTRMAAVSTVDLKPNTLTDVCWIESLNHGWLFLLPFEAGKGSLIAVGDNANALLAESGLVADQIAHINEGLAQLAASPQVTWPFCQSTSLSCGTAALRFDPLCGEGTGHAIREAILASAVIQAATKDFPLGQLSSHYESRLLHGFARHLLVCEEFYRTGGTGDWWSGERERLRQGMTWTQERIQQLQPSRFRLDGFELTYA